uniref:MMS19 nucleotide excision repair protein n=1 Tax=Gadus morhua TaxID=8049 RepID=A0A8C5B099_GADMO
MYSPSLTSNTPHTRARGVQLLSLVIQQCYGDLSESEVEVLIAFYENRLKDHYVIIPFVLQGLKALVSGFSLLPAGSAVSMLRSLFQDTHVQVSLHCPFVFELFTCSFYSPELKGLGADFVFGFVQSMDGERDPRNLVLAFQIANNIIHRGYDLGKFAEELFEVTSCYFPVDFSPPPNDPHGITQETLILSLRAVLAGTPRFAEFLLPLIIEKLDSDIQSAKIDSLQTLVSEVLLISISHRYLICTHITLLFPNDLCTLFSVSSDCQHHLCEPDLKLVWPSAKLLQAACSASYRASHIVAAVVIPGLVEQYNSRTQCAHRRTILEVLQGFIHTVKNTSQSEDDGESTTTLVEVPQVERLMEQLEELSITSGHVPSYTSAAKCYAGLVNKRPAGQFSGLTPVCDYPVNCPLCLQLAKGLLLRYHPLSTALTDKLFALLGDPELGPMVGDGFSLLMSDSADVLNRGCHADVRIMYRQRFFTENSAKLLQGFDSAAPDTKSSYLKALCHLVSSLPKEVQLTELPALLSLLLEALSCPDQVVQLSTLSCLVPVLTEPPPALIQQLEALVSRLLALTCSPTMTVRIESLRCLHAMSRFPEHEVIPLRARVLRALAKPLDDRKRLVRSVAVQARADWFLLGSPGGR